MAVNTHTVVIAIKQMGSRKVTRQLAGLTAALGALGYAAVKAGKALIAASDEMTNLGNKSRVFARNQGEAANRMATVVQVSRTMNMELSGVADVMQRVSLSAEQVGLSNEQVTKMVSNLSKATMLSGATSQEATGALRQFGQALAANRLSGQELNSIMEQTPMIAQLIANSMGIAVGQLRAYGKAGLITADVLKNALGGTIDDLERKFAKFEFPISALIVSFRRELTFLIDNIGKATGASDMLKKGFKELVDFMQRLNHSFATGGQMAKDFTHAVDAAVLAVKLLGTALASMAGGALVNWITQAVSASKAAGKLRLGMLALNLVTKANVWVALASAITGAAVAYFSFSQQIDRNIKPVTKLEQAQMALAAVTAGNKEQIKLWADTFGVAKDKLRETAEEMIRLNDVARVLALPSGGSYGFNIIPGESDAEGFVRSIIEQVEQLDSTYKTLKKSQEAATDPAAFKQLGVAMQATIDEAGRLSRVLAEGIPIYTKKLNTIDVSVGKDISKLREDFDATYDSALLLKRAIETQQKVTSEWGDELRKIGPEWDEIWMNIRTGLLDQLVDKLTVVNGEVDEQSKQFQYLAEAAEVFGIELSNLTSLQELYREVAEKGRKSDRNESRLLRERADLLKLGASALSSAVQANLEYTTSMERVQGAAAGVLDAEEKLSVFRRLETARRMAITEAIAGAGGGSPVAQMMGNQLQFDRDTNSLNDIREDPAGFGVTPEQIEQMNKIQEFRALEHIQNQQILEDQQAMWEMNNGLLEGELTLASARDGAFASMRDGFVSVAKPALDLAGNISKATAFAVDGLADSIATLATDGSANFKQLGLDFLKMITQMIVKMTVMMALVMAISAIPGGTAVLELMGASGGLIGSAAGAAGSAGEAGKAAGGPVTGGTPYLVGERGPELFVPPRSGTIQSARDMSMMGAPAPQVTIVNVDSQENVVNALGSQQAEAMILNVIRNNADAIRSLS